MLRVLPLLLLLGCADPLGWLEATHPERFEPPPEYVTYWRSVEDCVGKTGNFDRLRFYVSDSLPCPDYRWGCRGYWVEPHDIYLVRSVSMQSPIVRHEMIHDLLQGGGHPSRFFPRCEVDIE